MSCTLQYATLFQVGHSAHCHGKLGRAKLLNEYSPIQPAYFEMVVPGVIVSLIIYLSMIFEAQQTNSAVAQPPFPQDKQR